MRILVHDFAGHPFQVQLSRELARREHAVLHLHFEELQTPKGNVVRRPDDPINFAVEGVRLGESFDKWSFLRRHRQELRYGRLLADRVEQFMPDVLLSANTPLDVQERVIATASKLCCGMVIWVQDFYSVAIQYALRKKLGLMGSIGSIYYSKMERRQLNHCDQIVYITKDFDRLSDRWNVAGEKCHVIENWAPVHEIRPAGRDNAWAQRHDLTDKFCIVYSGTMGWKHNPKPLISIAERWRDDDRVRVVVVAEGPGRECLATQTTARALRNVKILDFQPYQQLPDVLATADILVGLLEVDAGKFSVPSKVLSYLCAGRPILLIAPAGNLASRIVTEADAGFVVGPGDEHEIDAILRRLMTDNDLRTQLGANGRRYAEGRFDIGRIGDRFEQVLMRAVPAEWRCARAAGARPEPQQHVR